MSSAPVSPASGDAGEPSRPGVPAVDPADPSTFVLFDLDGTVTDSYPGISASFVYALEQLGAPAPSAEFLQSVVGPPLLDSMLRYGFDEQHAVDAVRAYRARYDVLGWRENSVFDGMDALLHDLHAAGRTLAVATSKNERMAHRILEHFGLAPLFAFIGGASDDGARRTKADVVAHVLTALDVDPRAADVVLIGDRSHDVDGAASLGVPTYSVRWGYAHAGELEAAQRRAGGPSPERRIVETVPQLRKVCGV